MKNKKSYLLIFILILCSCSVLLSINPLSNEQDDMVNRNIMPYFSASDSHAYRWDELWNWGYSAKSYGVATDNSNNVYLAGETRDHLSMDHMGLVKYEILPDGSGVDQWDVRWNGGVGHGGARGYGVAVDSSENVYLGGMTWIDAPSGHSDMVLVKYNSFGVQKWNSTWGGTANDEGYGVAVDLVNDYVYLAGYTDSFTVGGSDMVLVQYDSDGGQIWNRTWGGSDDDVCNGVAVDSSYNVYLAGTTKSFGKGEEDMVLVKFDSGGNFEWNRTWGWIEEDMGQGVAVDSSGYVYLAGSTNYYDASGTDMVLVKYDDSGVEQWKHIWSGDSTDEGYGVAVDSLDNVYLTGMTYSFGEVYSDMVLVKYNNLSVQQWNHTYGGSYNEYGRGIAVDSVDNIYLAVMELTSPDMLLVKYDKVPEITIVSPDENKLFASVPPSFNISILGPELHSMWYKISEYPYTEIFLDNFTGTINQEEWDKAGTEVVTIKFYAKDLLNRVGVAEVSVNKDINAPNIHIYGPSEGRKYEGQVPYYSITIDEPNLDSIWYTIDGGVNNYTITPPPEWDQKGTHGDYINEEAWDAAPYDAIDIGIYANDTMGNIGYEEVYVWKMKPEPPGIPGYTPLILISTLGVITAVYVKTICKRKIIKNT